VASFVLRHIDEALWQRVKAKAAAENVQIKRVLVTLLETWANTPTTPHEQITCPDCGQQNVRPIHYCNPERTR
jgi:hypothetical protein